MSNKMSETLTERMKTLRMVRTSAVIRNPLLLEAIGLCPVVAIATSLKSAVFLAVVTAIELIACEVLASKFLKNVRRYLRVAVYFLVGAAIVFPIMYLVTKFIPEISLEFGVFLPLMAVNSLLALHCERVAVKRNVRDSLLDAVSVSVSYGAVTIIAGILREILGNGTIGGARLNLPVRFPVMLMPFGGLLILGFAAALLKSYIYKKYPQSSPDRAFNTSEVRQSLSGTLRELMNDDFNPYDEGEDGANTNDADALQKIKFPQKAEKSKPEKAAKNKPEKPKKKKVEKSKKKENKPKKKNQDIPNNVYKAEREITQERTYLDDFSDMLSDLESYKAKETGNMNANESEGDE